MTARVVDPPFVTDTGASNHAPRSGVPAPFVRRRAFRHLLLPGAVMLLLLVAYYAGGPATSLIVAPRVNRELGLLEHLQAAVLAAVAASGARAAWVAGCGRAMRRRGIVIAVVAGGLLAEELDYGRHHAALLSGRPAEWVGGTPALHNRSVGADYQVVDYLEKAANVGLAVWFALAPLALRPQARRALRVATATSSTVRRLAGRYARQVPSRWYAATVGVYVATS